jgi:deoxyribodipyrimidine photolyase
MTSIFIFRRDLRVDDNTALREACQNSQAEVPIFILTPEQLVRNPYKSQNAVQFMDESLKDLDQALRRKGSRLFKFFGPPEKVLSRLLTQTGAKHVYVNNDYDPSNNNGGWRFNASVGADATPYFRALNPWIQSVKHDPQTIYIKRWVPELQSVPTKHIHTWYAHHQEYPQVKYPAPIVDFTTTFKQHLERYRRAASAK